MRAAKFLSSGDKNGLVFLFIDPKNFFVPVPPFFSTTTLQLFLNSKYGLKTINIFVKIVMLVDFGCGQIGFMLEK
jgi:hypothetical protein